VPVKGRSISESNVFCGRGTARLFRDSHSRGSEGRVCIDLLRQQIAAFADFKVAMIDASNVTGMYADCQFSRISSQQTNDNPLTHA